MTDMIPLSEAAKHCGLTRQALKKAAQRGTLQAEKVPTPRGDVWMTTRADVDRYLSERRTRRAAELIGSAP